MGVDFPGRSEGKESEQLLFLSLFHVLQNKTHIILPPHVIGSSSYRLNLSCSRSATNQLLSDFPSYILSLCSCRAAPT